MGEHRLCRGLDDPVVTAAVAALWCSCDARIAVPLPPRFPRGTAPR
jgi:hypothetical protein